MNKREKMFSLVSQWRESGLTRKSFAKQHGLRLSSFNYWCTKQFNEVVKHKSHPSFIELPSVTDSTKPVSQAQIELSLPSGLMIKIY